jgi:serine/threonine protein kinase
LRQFPKTATRRLRSWTKTTSARKSRTIECWVLGGGGMGLVLQGGRHQVGTPRRPCSCPKNWQRIQSHWRRFKREARRLGADHPNVCTIYEIGEHEGTPFIAMQLLQGETLSERMESGAHLPFPIEELVAIAIQVADGLDAAHQEGIIHRDIKPANIFVTNRNEVKLLDFGLAKLADATEQVDVRLSKHSCRWRRALLSTLVEPGSHGNGGIHVAGAGARQVDARTDLFSFGLVLYEMATGNARLWEKRARAA